MVLQGFMVAEKRVEPAIESLPFLSDNTKSRTRDKEPYIRNCVVHDPGPTT